MKTKLVIFGITGDLSTRKLLPALEHIIGTGSYDDVSIVGVSRGDVDVAELVQSSTGSDALADRTTIFTMDLAHAGDYIRLREFLALQPDEQAVMYLSVPPSASTQIVEYLGQAGLNTPNVKLLFEKPFGFDLETAQDAIVRTGRYFKEAQIYRIDHYMAKEVAAEIVRLRSDADNHHHSWGNQSIRAVDVVASEKIGIEGRTTFYEQTGALRDFIQGHLMQLLSLILMPIPDGFDAESLAQHRLEALTGIALADPARSVRAQYAGYQKEVDNIGSKTETYAAVGLISHDPHWEGVALQLVAGKNLDQKQSFIAVHYNDGTTDVFDEASMLHDDDRLPDAYERVLMDAIDGRKAIFTSGDEVLRSWQILAPVQSSWDQQINMMQYQPGSHWSDIQ
jgi:glucose-6-phosphate 1-dehydrogenase